MTIVDTPIDKITANTNLLLGKRDPNTNITHPSVLSSPTRRIPLQCMKDLDAELSGKNSVNFSLWNESSNVHTITQLLVEYLLCRKLGITEDSRNLQTSVGFGYMEKGIPKQLSEHDTSESIAMYNVVCHIEGLSFPTKTASYYDIGWRNVGNFINNELESPEEVCAGLCISTSKKSLIMLGTY